MAINFTVNFNSTLMVIGGIFSWLGVSLLWNVITEEANGKHNGRHHAANFNIFGIIVLWGTAVVANIISDAAVKRVCTMMGCALLIFLVSGISSDFHTIPITSISYLHMLRSWVALPFGWDNVKGNTPSWARKAFAGLVLSYFGMILSFGSLLKYEPTPPPLNRSRARKMNQLKMALSAVSGFCGGIGCICLWSCVVATVPSGDVYKNNPLYFPNPSATYDTQTYGAFALGRGMTPEEGYGEVMMASGYTVVSFLLVVALLVSSSEEVANVTLIMSTWYGWFFLSQMFELRFELDNAISGKDLASMTTGYIFVWFSSIATIAVSIVVLTVQSQMSFTRGPLLPPTNNKIVPMIDDGDETQYNRELSPIVDAEVDDDADDDEQDDETHKRNSAMLIGKKHNDSDDEEEEEDDDDDAE